jgi:hypothetical protein
MRGRPEQPPARNGVGTDEDRRRHPEPMQNQPRDLEHIAVAIVEGHEHRPQRQRPPAAARDAPIIEADRMTELCDDLAVSAERVFVDVKVFEGHWTRV